jgi:ubiquinone/menaquinone biosynthesis C-methylase UbiE
MESFFDFASKVGLTKHVGGSGATDELVNLCYIREGMSVLDVGCGVGVTPAYIAKNFRCRVVGVDINEGMVKRSMERARREKVTASTEFMVADAQELPFGDNSFDAVITESVTAFPDDKQKAVKEYARVTRPGGYVGLNESTWLKVPPPPEMIAWVSQDLGATVQPLTSDEWIGLLEHAALKNIVVRSYDINVKKEARGIIQRYGYGGMFRILFRMLLLYSNDQAYRGFVKKVRKDGITPKNLDEYFGYGLYIGQK